MAGSLGFSLRDYNVIKKLASGGMAELFLVTRKAAQFHNRFQNRFYVLKRVLPEVHNKSEYMVYLKDEAKALSLLHHSNIIAFHDFFFENDEFYLVMEFVNGMTMREFFNDLNQKSQYLSVEYLLHIIVEIAAGLDHAHRSYDFMTNKSLNLVHRDLNPSNVMISYDGQIKIIDFGISKFDIRDDFTKTGMLKGKFGYMSPEQVNGDAVDSRTDIFALGILCWEVLTNKRLFDGEDDFEKYNKVLNYRVDSITKYNSILSKELDQIIMKALAPKVKDRYQRVADFAHDINRYLLNAFPDFRTENFERLVSKMHERDLKESIARLRRYLEPEESESDENVRLNREFYLKQSLEEEDKLRSGSANSVRSDPHPKALKFNLPEHFDHRVNVARLKVDVPQNEKPSITPSVAPLAPQQSRGRRALHRLLRSQNREALNRWQNKMEPSHTGRRKVSIDMREHSEKQRVRSARIQASRQAAETSSGSFFESILYSAMVFAMVAGFVYLVNWSYEMGYLRSIGSLKSAIHSIERMISSQ